MKIEIFRGACTYSDFRLSKLTQQLGAVITDLKRANARFIHFAQIDATGEKIDRQLVQHLLDDSPQIEQLDQACTFWVVPRIGTISPWSTKATDIAHHCALRSIKRLERGVEWQFQCETLRDLSKAELKAISRILVDKMTESLLTHETQFNLIFEHSQPADHLFIDVLGGGRTELEKANQAMGLALAADEIDYLYQAAKKAKRNLTDVELMMFSQVNSEHCRHKIFNAQWTIDGDDQDKSLFAMIRNTHELTPKGTLIAYKDNAAVIEGSQASRFYPDVKTHLYNYHHEPVHILAKVETHNHPTAISPFPGAATGSGGEIRDEGATGRGGKPKAGVTGFSVSNLRLPQNVQAWEGEEHKPAHIATPLKIMLDGPIGGASFNNEFGRPNIAGYFRTFEQATEAQQASRFGYHKPIMIAGGMGNIRDAHVEKQDISNGEKIIVLGGPAMLIGLGGGAASSVASGHSDEDLDFASVQRGNPEMQRRCQEVIDTCCAMGEQNPIVSIHDVGAGGLSNAVPELVHDSSLGGKFELRRVLNDEPGMSPMEIWCNEAQERYVVAVSAQRLTEFEQICQRERCLYCVIGDATESQHLKLTDNLLNNESGHPIDIDMGVLFGNPPKMHRKVIKEPIPNQSLDLSSIEITDAVTRLLHLPTIADKTFLITIGDRSVSGMISRDQMVGPWQVPVADVAVTTSSYEGYCGEAMAMGERTPIAILNPAASGRIAVGEVLTNIAAARIKDIKHIKLSANWMAAAGFAGQDAALYETVQAVGMDLCPALGISIPVGKDSMSMRTVWHEDDQQLTVASPVSLIVTGFAPVADVRKTLTPVLTKSSSNLLLLVDLGEAHNRLGGSCLSQVYNAADSHTPDVNSAQLLKSYFDLIQQLNQDKLILAYHDRSDGGLIVSLLEMAFASRCGLDIDIEDIKGDPKSILFNEELGGVLQIAAEHEDTVRSYLEKFGLSHCSHFIGRAVESDHIEVSHTTETVFQARRTDLHRMWSSTSWQMQSMRDNPECAQQEYDRLLDKTEPGLYSKLTFDVSKDICAPYINSGVKPRVAILREQGVNSHTEMAAAFDRAGFHAIDVHMSDLVDARQSLDSFVGLVACGGFSFGDVLGAGQGWAKSILFNNQLQDQFSNYFEHTGKFSLGVCNGCQMMSAINSLIPGAQHWPQFVRNKSEQYEARQIMVKIESSPSIFFDQMAGSEFPVVVAHGEGQAVFESEQALNQTINDQLICARFIDNHGQVSEIYPFNPNGSTQGITALTSEDGRATILMPHPERVFRSVTNSWRSDQWEEDSPWMRIFRNARCWVD